MDARIVEVTAREILDSRGHPTVEAEVRLGDGAVTRASVPAGASKGAHEARERRDGGKRYGGLGVRGAVASVENEIGPLLAGRHLDQNELDAAMCELDGTPDKSRLGANALLAVSLACARAGAVTSGVPLWRHIAADRPVVLPLPMVNILSGGMHAGRQLDFQDFLVIPVGADTFSDALEMVVAVYRAMGKLLSERGLSTLKADEGGFGPRLASNGVALELLQAAVERAGLRPAADVLYAIDVAATHFFDAASGRYRLQSEHRDLGPGELVDFIAAMIDDFPVASIEDPLAEDDWDAWASLTARLGKRLQIIGDDLFATNPERLDRGIADRSANAVLVKMNQIGTLTETLQVVDKARAAGMRTVISARSGETEDDTLADLAVGTGAGQIKIGSVAQSERLAKYNQLLRIEQELGSDAVLASWSSL